MNASKTALGHAAIHELQRFTAQQRRRKIRKHPRNARAIDARHKIHVRPNKVKRSHHRPLQILESRDVAFREEFRRRIAPAARRYRSIRHRRFVFDKQTGVRSRPSINFRRRKVNQPGARLRTSFRQRCRMVVIATNDFGGFGHVAARRANRREIHHNRIFCNTFNDTLVGKVSHHELATFIVKPVLDSIKIQIDTKHPPLGASQNGVK